MTDRILPEPDLYAICPLEGSILSFYKGQFEAAYILLNPFIRPISITAERFAEASELNANDICSNCEAVLWSEVQTISGLPSLAAIDIALRTSIGGLKKELASEEYVGQLRAALKNHRIFEPSEGSFPELTQNAIFSFIQSLGHQWVWVGDEHCTERKLYWIDDLKPPSARNELIRSSVFTPDKSLLWTVHWDSHFSLFCSSSENIEKLSQWSEIEGFRCDPDTEVYWSVRNG